MTDENEQQTDDFGLDSHDPEVVLRSKLDEMESQENAEFRVFRQHSGNTAKMGFCFTVPADQYSFTELLQKIKEDHGGGDYRVHLRGPTHQGRNQLIANQVVTVETPRNTNPATTQPQDRPSELQPILERMMDRVEKMEERLAQPTTQPQQQDPMEMMQKFIAMFTSMQEMMPGNKAGKEKSIIEQIEEAEKIAERFGKSQQDESGFQSLVKEGLQPLIKLAQAEAAKKGSSQPQPQPQPNPQPSQSRETPQMPQDEMTKKLGPMASSVKTLLAAANRGGDPEVYASMVLDFLPEEKYAEVYEFLSTEGCIDAIIQYVPEVEPHKEWFQSLSVAVLTELDPGEGPEDTGGHVDGNDDGAGTEPVHLDGATARADGHAQDASDHEPDGQGGEGSPSDP